jgi:hypothetical protein
MSVGEISFGFLSEMQKKDEVNFLALEKRSSALVRSAEYVKD